MNKIKNKFKKIYLFPAILLILIVPALIYIQNYYKSTISLEKVKEQSPDLEITLNRDMIIFSPKKSSSKKGLIFYPGAKVEEKAYAPLMANIANKGYTCVIIKMPFRLAMFRTDGANEAMDTLGDVDEWYLGGHSLGGAVSSMYAYKYPQKLSGVIYLGAYPSKDLSQTSLSTISIYGSNDGVLNKETFNKNKKYDPKDNQYIEIYGGNHAYFGNYGTQKGDNSANITRNKQQTITAKEIVRFMEKKDSIK